MKQVKLTYTRNTATEVTGLAKVAFQAAIDQGRLPVVQHKGLEFFLRSDIEKLQKPLGVSHA